VTRIHDERGMMSSLYSGESSRKIQILRAAAIFAVVAIHTCSFGAVGIIVRPYLNFSVALFLALSGYLTRAEIPDIGAFYKKRLLRVFIPYVIWSLIYTAVRNTWTDFPVNFATGYSCGVFYFLVVYMQLTLLSPLIGKLVRSRFRWAGYLITPAAIFLQYVLEWSDAPLSKPFNEIFAPVWFLFFYLGMAVRYDLSEGRARFLSDGAERQKTVFRTALLLPLSIFLQTMEGYIWKVSGSSRMPYTQIKLGSMMTSVFVIILAFAWISSSSRIPFSDRVTGALVYIGDISFGIYLTHILFKDMLEETIWQTVNMIFPLTTVLVLLTNIMAIYLLRKILSPKICRAVGFI
jgi:peptidoglycan/LPS O-acetylase OafA/YrhL